MVIDISEMINAKMTGPVVLSAPPDISAVQQAPAPTFSEIQIPANIIQGRNVLID